MVAMRGCGFRKKGGIYLESETSPWGRPLEEFLICPPIPVDLQAWGVADVGTTLVEREVEGRPVAHVVDVVGRKYYPNAADFIEECRVLGASRRSSLASARDYARLQPGSRMLLVHRHGYIPNYLKYTGSMTGYERRATRCPHGKEEHDLWREQGPGGRPGLKVGPDEMCAQLYYHDVEGEVEPLSEEKAEAFARSFNNRADQRPGGMGGAVLKAEGESWRDAVAKDFPRLGTRRVAQAVYEAHARPAGVKPEYEYALFMSLPITRIVLVDPDGDYRSRAEKASKAGLPFEVVRA